MWKSLVIIVSCFCIAGSIVTRDVAFLASDRELEQKISSLQHQMEILESLIHKPAPINKVRTMRVTGYTPTGKKTALGDKLVVGKTAAVSRNCKELLGEYVYIEGIGVRYVHDLTAKWLDDEFNICTIDVAVPTEKDAYKIGNSNRTVVHIEK